MTITNEEPESEMDAVWNELRAIKEVVEANHRTHQRSLHAMGKELNDVKEADETLMQGIEQLSRDALDAIKELNKRIVKLEERLDK